MLRILSVKREEENYIVTIERADKSTVIIAIPAEARDTHENRCIAQQVYPLGLNFVSTGHYTKPPADYTKNLCTECGGYDREIVWKYTTPTKCDKCGEMNTPVYTVLIDTP